MDAWTGALSRRMRGYRVPGWRVAPRLQSLHTFNVEGCGVLGRGAYVHTHPCTHTPVCTRIRQCTHTQARWYTSCVPSPALKLGLPVGQRLPVGQPQGSGPQAPASYLRPNAD